MYNHFYLRWMRSLCLPKPKTLISSDFINLTLHRRKASTSWSLDTNIQYILCRQANPCQEGGGSILYIKIALNPIERKAIATRTAQIIQVDINPKNELHIKIVLIYRNATITAADNDMFYESLEEILLTKHECIIMGNFNQPNIDWTLGRPSPAPGSKFSAASCRQQPHSTCAWT